MSRARRLLAVCCVLFPAAFAQGQPPKNEIIKHEPAKLVTALPQLPAGLHDALQDQRYVAAIRLIDDELAKADVKAGGYLLYLKGRAQTELKLFGPALKTFEVLETQYPKSRWLARARFGKADVFVRQRDYRQAGTIYRAEAERLLSDKRQDELTGIYLEFADRYFAGIPSNEPGQAKKPDFNQAVTYYREAQKLRSSRERLQKIEFRIARCLQELKQYPQAIAAYQAFLKTHADKETPQERRAALKLEVEARFQLGLSQLLAGQNADARKTFQDFVRSDAAKKDDSDFLVQATYQLAKTYGVPAPPSVPNLELGVAALRKFVKQFAKHKLAPQAEFEIAQSELHHGRYDQAVATLKKLIANDAYKSAKQVADARRLLGETYFAQKKFDDAIAAFRAFLDEHPTDANWSAVQRRVLDAEFAAAGEQLRQKHYAAARKLWSTFLNKYPLDARAPQILFAFGQMNYAEAIQKHTDALKAAKAAGKKPEPRALAPDVTKLFEDANADWKRLVSKYPGTNEASHGAYMIGVTLEDFLARLPDALHAYKKVTGAYQRVAQQRIAALTGKKLDVVTERKFRSSEKPVIKIRTRNIESVTVKVYRIDMVDYFRKMHLASGVETLDIALIDPDKSWEYKVAGYEKYRQLVNDVAIPIDGPGVTAVTVSSEKLEATTMVIVSDLDVIVKASRNELFVFAQNMRTNKPVEGASLLISDGKTVFAEETTGKDGILQRSYEKLKTVRDLRVFAVSEGHAASTVSNLDGLQFAVGLAPKGYLYSDRPAYRAGELVNLRGIIRWVENDTYTFKPGEKYKLDVYDARGRVIHSKDVTLGKFGTFADRLMLPESAVQGNYRVHLHQPGKTQSYETLFSVHEIKLEPIQLTVDVPKKVYYRGEKIEGTLTLKYYYGTPLSNRSVRYQLSGDRVHFATTDAKGQVKFTFETTQYNESQQLAISAAYPERNIAAQATVFIATRGFAVSVSTRRPVYIAGETFDATVKVADPAGKPLATGLKLEVFELLPVGRIANPSHGKGEKLIATHDLKSDKDKGEALQTLRIDNAGYYRLRATGTDRFNNPVSGEHVVRISGDDDAIRLRILAETHSYKVGDVAKVQLHWREADALALVTFEGAKVLGYRLVTLKQGANTLDLPMAAGFAPNFVLSVAVMEKNRFHQAQSEFLVARKLTIKLTVGQAFQPDRKGRKTAKGASGQAGKPDLRVARPGDELQVEVTTTDPQGKPVSAELSLALIQKNLLDRFSDQQGPIAAFFGGGYRTPSVRAFTSATFRYRPATRGISKYLLAEEERKKILDAELATRRFIADADRIRSAERQAQRNAQRSIGGQTLPSATYLSDDVQYFPPGKEEDAAWKAMDEVERSAIPFYGSKSGSRSGFKSASRRGGISGFDMPNAPAASGRLGGQQGQQAQSAANDFRRTKNGQGPVGGIGGFGYGGPGGAAPADRDDGKKSDPKAILNQMNRLAVNGGGQFEHFNGQPSLYIKQQQWSIGFQSALKDLSNNTNDTIVAVAQNGEFQVVNGIPIAKLNSLTKDGLRILPAMGASETGYWNPVVVTGADGKAVVTFRLPNRSTAWKLRAKGTDAGVLSGDAEDELITKKDLFGDLKLPLAFYQGDKATVLVEVHNAKLKKGTRIDIALQTKIGNRVATLTRTITSAGPGIAEVEFPIDVTAGEAAEFKLTVTPVGQAFQPDRKGRKAPVKGAPGQAGKPDVLTASVPVRPFGLPVFATASGSSNQNTIVFIQHDKKLDVRDPKLEIVIGPSINRTLLDAVVGGGLTRSESRMWTPSNPVERHVSDAVGGVALLKMIRGTRTTDTPEAQALAGRIQSAVASLVSSQGNDGGWSWSGNTSVGAGLRAGPQSDRFLSSRAVWAIAAARDAGFAVPNDTYNKAVQYLRTQFTASKTSDREGQAILLHGLSQAGAADFAFANRLYRERNSLSTSGLLHVALVLIKLDRKEMAGQLLDLVKLPSDKSTVGRIANPSAKWWSNVPPWMQSPVELRALFLLALESAKPADRKCGELADWLLAARRGSRWSPEKANGPAIAALAEWFSRTKFLSEKYTLEIYVNGGLVKKIAVDPSKDGSTRLAVPAKLLTKNGNPQRINLDVTGRGTFSYSAVMSGFVPADKLKSTTDTWRIARHYEPALRMLDGQAIPRGFGVLQGSYEAFRNPLTQLPLGERGLVTLHVTRHDWNSPERDYLVVTEPIPSGCSVLPNSVTGGFDRFEISPGTITFYVGNRQHSQTMSYTLVGYLPGGYKAAPTVVHSFYRPERIAVAGIKPLTTLARGAKTQDKYRLSPQELYEFGKRLLAKRDYKAADGHLTTLITDWNLRPDVYKDVVLSLFRTAREVKRNDALVKYFEIIKERFPEVEIDFDAILQVAAAYRDLGEYERSYLVYRATIEASFQRESQIAGFLNARQEFIRSTQIMETLLANYPAESYIATSTYALANEVYGKAGELAANKKLRDAGLTKAGLIATNIRMLNHYLSTWPKDPAVDQASFAMLNSYLDLENYKTAIARATKFAERCPQSKLLDSFWYVIGYSQFALGKHDDALKMVQKVADTKVKDPATGVEVASANKWQAVYIMGQIYHSIGQPQKAIAEYKRVKTRFPDAEQSIDYFTRKAISLPEVATVKPGDAAKVELKFRNIPTVNVKVYRIDLLKFGLMQRNLNRITAINLAGIRPLHEQTVVLGSGHDYRDRKQDLSLPLKKEGAYLVVCRGADLYASGLVLVSPLTLEVQEDAVSGRVRVTVNNRVFGLFARDAHVKVIGSANSDFKSGKTDLRGIFVADGIRGTSTVIAKAEGSRYAFFRGKTALGTPAPNQPPAAQTPMKAGEKQSGKDALLKSIRGQNSIFNRDNRKQYQELLENKSQGVKAKSLK